MGVVGIVIVVVIWHSGSSISSSMGVCEIKGKGAGMVCGYTETRKICEAGGTGGARGTSEVWGTSGEWG